MKKLNVCLNHGNEEVQKWFKNVGMRKTYEQYVKNGYYLPSWDAYIGNEKNSIPIQNVRDLIGDLIPIHDYRFENLSKILFDVPIETQAAFWNNTFYFQDNVNKLQIGEEVFHALFQTIFDTNTRNSLFSIAKRNINLKEEVKKYSELFPSIMDPLSQQQKEERVMEEWLATQFRNWYAYNKDNVTSREEQVNKLSSRYKSIPKKLIEILYDFFDVLRQLFNLSVRDKRYLDSLFQNIINGEYKDSQYQPSETSTPLLSVLKYTQNGRQSELSETESEKVVNTIVGTFMRRKEIDSESSDEEILSDTLEAVREYLKQTDLKHIDSIFESNVFLGVDDDFNEIRGENPEHTLLLDEVNKRISKLKKIREPYLEEDQGENISDENEPDAEDILNVSDTTISNEKGWSGWNNWMRTYISTVSVESTKITLSNGKKIQVITPINANTLFYGVARGLQNTSNDIERLMKLIQYSELNDGSNVVAKAFVNQLIGDTIKDYDSSSIENTIKKLKRIYNTKRNSGETDVKYYNRISKKINALLKDNNTRLLNGMIKGLDMWRREMMVQTIDPITNKIQSFNANKTGNTITTQLEKWRRQYDLAERNLDQLKEIDKWIYVETSEQLTKSSKNIKRIFKEQLGVDIAESTVKFILLSTSDHSKFDESDVDFYNLFKGDVFSYVKENDVKNLIGAFSRYTKEETLKTISEIQEISEQFETGESDLNPSKFSTIFDRNFESRDGGLLGRLENLARINSTFDENVVETTYKNAENKTIYGFQNKTFALEFSKNVMSKNFIEQRLNKGFKVIREDGRGNPIYLNEGIEFVRNNYLLQDFVEENGNFYTLKKEFEEEFQNFRIFSVDGIRQVGNRERDGVTFGNITTPEFDAFRLNMMYDENRVIQVNNKKYVPFYVGNYEAKRSADFVYMPFKVFTDNEGNYKPEVANILRNEIKKEYDRIKRIVDVINNNSDKLSWNENGEAIISQDFARKYLGTFAIEKYNVGKIKRVTLPDEKTAYMGIRGLEFSDALNGMLNNENTQNLLNAARSGVDFNTAWLSSYNQDLIEQQNNIVNQTIERLRFSPLNNIFGTKESPAIRPFREALINNLFNTMAYNQLMHGDGALLFKNDGVDIFKRGAGKNAAIQSSEYYIINPKLGITEPQVYIKYVVGKELKGVAGYDPKEKIDIADAQNWGTTKYYRKQLYAQGKLDAFSARLLDKIDIGMPLNKEEERLMFSKNIAFNVMKTVGYDGQSYIKKADFMLSRQYTSILRKDIKDKIKILELEIASLDPISQSDIIATKEEELKNLYRPEEHWLPRPNRAPLHYMRVALERENIDLYMPESASKMLNVDVHDNVADREFKNIKNSVHYLEAKNYGLQLENPVGKRRIYDPTQMMDIIFNEQNEEVSVIFEGKERKLGELSKLYEQYLVDRTKGTYNVVKREFILPNGEVNFPVLFDRMLDMLIESDADRQTVEIFRQGINPNIGITREKFEHLYFSIFTKGVLKSKVNGDSLAHVSSYGNKQLKKIVRHYAEDGSYVTTWEVVNENSDEYYNAVYNNNFIELSFQEGEMIYDGTKETDALRSKLDSMYREGVPVYFIDELRHLKPRYHVENGVLKSKKPIAYYTESLIPQWNEKIDNNSKSRWMFGTRIPSQDKHSAVNVEWTGMMPSFYGNTIVTAKEIITISGSDFDVDKLFVTRPEFYTEKGEVKYYGEEGNNEFKEYIEFLKSTHEGFNKEYKKLLKGRHEFYNEIYGEIKDLINRREELREQAKKYNPENEDELLERRILHYDIQQINDQLRDLYEERQLVDDELPMLIDKILSDLHLPTSATFKTDPLLVSNEVYSNPFVRNNQILELRQIALTNDSTLNEENGKAIYKTAATQDVLKQLVENSIYPLPYNEDMVERKDIKRDEKGNIIINGDGTVNVYMFKDRNGESIFGKKVNVPIHSFISHSISHQNTTTGKRNISEAVNANSALITILKGKLELNGPFNIQIDDHLGSFGFLDANHQRIFDHISALISAATDEAKDQQNATYNISYKALGIVRVIIGLGFPVSTAILFINQPIVQEYFKRFTLREQAILSQDELSDIYKTEKEILTELGMIIESTDVELDLNTLVENLKNNKTVDSNDILSLLEVFERMSVQFNEINRLVKLRKGFEGKSQQLKEFERLFHSLGFYLKNPKRTMIWESEHPIDTRKILGNSNLPLINFYISDIIPDQISITSKLLLEFSPFYLNLENQIYNIIGDKLSNKDKEHISSSLFEFISVFSAQLNNTLEVNEELLVSGKNSLGSRILKLKSEIRKLEKNRKIVTEKDRVLSTLIGNTVLNRLVITKNVDVGGKKYDTISLNTFSKVSSEEQDNLMSALRLLDIATNDFSLYKDSPEYKNIAQDLFSYFVTKDAYQFKSESISKIFPARYFSEHGKALENLINGKDPVLFNISIETLRKAFFDGFIKNQKNYKYFPRLLHRVQMVPKSGLWKQDENTLRFSNNVGNLTESDIKGLEETFNLSFDEKGIVSPPLYVNLVEPGIDYSIQTLYELQSVNGINVNTERGRGLLKKGAGFKDVVYIKTTPTNNYFQSIYTQSIPNLSQEEEIQEAYEENTGEQYNESSPELADDVYESLEFNEIDFEPKLKTNPVRIGARLPKDQTKANYADGIIAYGTHSTGGYAEAFGGTRTSFKEGEVIMISVNGNSRPNQKENVEKTKRAIDQAISQGVSAFIADNKTVANSSHNSGGEGVIREYLLSKGLIYKDFKGVGLYIVPKQSVTNLPKSNYYEGDIKPEPNTVFVFGSNPEGKHGLGAAKVAMDQFGAIYGQGEGLQGNAYALPTKDLNKAKRLGLYSPAQIKTFMETKVIPYYKANPFTDVVNKNPFERSINPEQIINSIQKLYEQARINPSKEFKIAYKEGLFGYSLNGYLHGEMIEMFNAAGPIPSNIIFSKEWVDTGKLNIQSKVTPQQSKQLSEQSNNIIPKANIPQNLVSGVESFGTKQEANNKAKELLGDNPHSIDMIEAGLRTRTTRSASEMQKYNIKVGDIVMQFGKSADGTTKQILTRITAIHPKGTPGFFGTWEKEGWTADGVKAIERFKDGAAAIEFEVIKPNKETFIRETSPIFEEYGTFYRFQLENGIAVSGEYRQGNSGKWKPLSNKKLKKYEELKNKSTGETSIEESTPSSETKSTELIFSFKDGKTVNLPFPLNAEQKSALLELEKFIKNPSLTDNQITLTGYAGTGKTSIISLFDKYLKTLYIRPVYSSPTHRANAVTKQKNPHANVFTLHSLFGLSGHINLEDGNYTLEDLKFAQQNKVKIKQEDTIIVDEASRVSDELYEFLEDAKKRHSLNIIYVGDPEQLNPPGQTTKSKVFEKGKQVKLTKVERTGDNPILRESTNLRNGKDFSYISETTPEGGIEFINTSSRKRQIIAENFLSDEFKNNKQYFRVLSAKKRFFPEITRIARESLFGEENVKTQINKGEVLMGMNNFDVDYDTGQPLIINSGDYEVVEVSEGTKSVKIGMNETIEYKGFYISVKNLMEESDDLKQVFVVDKSESYINKLKFAEAISDLNILGAKSKKAKNYADAAMYFQMARDLEKQLAFMEEVRDAQGKLKIKPTFDYGYGMTIDKSQGGTYNKVMVLADSIAYPFTKERQKQLRYTGVSRASDFVYVVYTPNELRENIDDEYIPYDEPYIVDDLSDTASIDDLFDDGISPENFNNCPK